MDLDDFRMILSNSGVDVWTFIDTAITVASLDYGLDLRNRRDQIVERLYASVAPRCRNCNVSSQSPNGFGAKVAIEKEHSRDNEGQKGASPLTPQSIHRDDDEDDDENETDPYAGLFDDEETKILRIKEHLEDPDQSEDSLVELLQSLADMDITFKALKETDIGRHVNRLRKHSSNDVRKLVKHLVRKWKDLVDEWVKLNTSGAEAETSNLIADGDSPQQNAPRNPRNGHHQVPDFAYSPIPHNGGSSGSDKNNSEPEPKPKTIPSREAAPAKPRPSAPVSASAPPPNRPQKDTAIDPERLASARRRLQENYQEAQNAKKQRTIQVMDIHEIPKPKNAFFAKNKGGSQGRFHR